MARILVIDGDLPIRRFLRVSLAANGHEALEAGSAAEGLDLAGAQPFDLVIVDPVLPDGEGRDVVGAIHAQTETPIIVVSARGDEAAKVDALDRGADDYVVKPFGAGELMARVRAILRHKPVPVNGDVLRVGRVTIDIPGRLVTKQGMPVRLSRREFELLRVLAASPGHVLPHRTLLEGAWGPERARDTTYLRVFINQLRHKLEDDPTQPRLIVTEPGIGYRLKIR